MFIQVKITNQYGNDRILPVCENAKLFCAIANTKTLTESMIKNIKLLGYVVVVVQDAKTPVSF